MNCRAGTAFVLLSLLALMGCTPGPTPVETASALPPCTATPDPTEGLPLGLARWEEIQAALAAELLPFELIDHVLCEWEVLGGAEPDVYVWAVCVGLPPAGLTQSHAPRASIPAVIAIEDDGTAIRVTIPAYGQSYAEGVQELFPSDVQELIFSRSADIAGMAEHAAARRARPEPPLIILAATPQP